MKLSFVNATATTVNTAANSATAYKYTLTSIPTQTTTNLGKYIKNTQLNIKY